MKTLLVLLIAAGLLLFAACGGNDTNAKPSSDCGSGSCGDNKPNEGNKPCGSDETPANFNEPKTPEEARDRYLAAMSKLDADGMRPLIAKSEASMLERLDKDMARGKEQLEKLEFKETSWKQVGDEWVYTYSQTAYLKNGKTDGDPKRTIRVVNEDGKWRIAR